MEIHLRNYAGVKDVLAGKLLRAEPFFLRFETNRERATRTQVNTSISVERQLITGSCFECLIIE